MVGVLRVFGVYPETYPQESVIFMDHGHVVSRGWWWFVSKCCGCDWRVLCNGGVRFFAWTLIWGFCWMVVCGILSRYGWLSWELRYNGRPFKTIVMWRNVRANQANGGNGSR